MATNSFVLATARLATANQSISPVYNPAYYACTNTIAYKTTTTNQLSILGYNGSATLSYLQNFGLGTGINAYCLVWSLNSQYLIVGHDIKTTTTSAGIVSPYNISVFSTNANGTINNLVSTGFTCPVGSTCPSSSTPNGYVSGNGLSLSANGDFLAVGTNGGVGGINSGDYFNPATVANSLFIFSFNETTGLLTTMTSHAFPTGIGVSAVDWNQTTTNVLATLMVNSVTSCPTANNNVQVLTYDQVPNQLMVVTTTCQSDPSGLFGLSMQWSPGGQCLATTWSDGYANFYSYNNVAKTISISTRQNVDQAGGDFSAVTCGRWSPDGQFLFRVTLTII